MQCYIKHMVTQSKSKCIIQAWGVHGKNFDCTNYKTLFYSFISFFVCSFVHSFIHSFIRSSIRPSVHPFVCSFVHLVCPPVLPSVCLSVCPPVHWSIRLSICTSVCLSVHPSISQLLSNSSRSLFIHLCHCLFSQSVIILSTLVYSHDLFNFNKQLFQ